MGDGTINGTGQYSTMPNGYRQIGTNDDGSPWIKTWSSDGSRGRWGNLAPATPSAIAEMNAYNATLGYTPPPPASSGNTQSTPSGSASQDPDVAAFLGAYSGSTSSPFTTPPSGNTYSLQSTSGGSTPTIPNLAFNSSSAGSGNAGGFTNPQAIAVYNSLRGLPIPGAEAIAMAQAAQIEAQFKSQNGGGLLPPNAAPPLGVDPNWKNTTSSTAINNGQDPVSAINISQGTPYHTGNTTTLYPGQSTSEGTAGMSGPAQTDGAVGTPAGGGASGQLSGSTSNPAGAYPATVPTSSSQPFNANGGGSATQGGSAPTATTTGGLLPSSTPSSGTYQTLSTPGVGTAPSSSNPYAGLLNPFLVPINGATYQARLAGQGVANAEQQYGLAAQRMRDDLAARGLSQAGTSGIEAANARDLTLQTAQARTQALNDAATQAATQGAQFELAKAQGNLNYGNQAFDQYYRGALLPSEVQGQNITNETNNANLQLIKQNWDKIQQKIAAGTDLSVAEAQFQAQLAAHPEVAMALGILPDLLKSGGQVAGALLPAAIAAV